MEVAPGSPPKYCDQRRFIQARDMSDGGDADAAKLLGRYATYSPESLNSKRMEKSQLAVRRHDEKAVRLRHAACNLGQEFGPRHTHRDRQADLLPDLRPQASGDLNGSARDPLQSANVEERLVDRQPFDERRRAVEDL